jgi:hypothetical protein
MRTRSREVSVCFLPADAVGGPLSRDDPCSLLTMAATGGQRQRASAEALRASEEGLRASITGLPVGALAIDLEAGGDQAALEHSLPITGDSPREPTVRM